MFKKEQK